MDCLICGNKVFKPYYYPPTLFNNKTFTYHECTSCYSAQISPLPDDDDMKLMYGSNDHSYLLSLKDDELLNFSFTYPKYNHQRFQLQFFKKFIYKQYGNTLLDIGCGSGYYMNHAKSFGFTCVGIEFSTDFAKLLRAKTGLDIFSFEEFSKKFPEGKQFDLIHLGHVLEHSTNPKQFIESLKPYTHAKTIIIVDGPLEKNKCLSRFVIMCGSLLRKNKSNTYHPQHITFTNAASQLTFFEKAGLTKINYTITEQMFPFPSKLQGETFKNKLLFLLGRISVNLSKVIPGAGNVFHYAGRFK
jgi:2-polyprenyl-3-methyl-5-hydroxy-6-metoxy-1,4-benzoquinol methylase